MVSRILGAGFCGAVMLVIFAPSLSIASEGSAQFFVAAWLVRLWLGIASGTAIVVGVLVALDSYSADHTTDPVLNQEDKVVLEKKYKLSYQKIGGGLLCVLLGCLLFVTTVFLLPDKRTGHSGLGKIVSHFKADQGEAQKNSSQHASNPSDDGH